MPKPGDGYFRCDSPEDLASDGSPDPWGNMTDAGRSKIFGLPSEAVVIVACWSGYVDDATGAYDAPPPDTVAGISTTSRTGRPSWRLSTSRSCADGWRVSSGADAVLSSTGAAVLPARIRLPGNAWDSPAAGAA